MIRYRLRYGIIVSLDSDDQNESAAIAYEGEPVMVRSVRDALSGSYGAFGHLITDSTTPIDLAAAMQGQDMERFTPQLIEGAQLVEGTWNPGIPPGAKT